MYGIQVFVFSRFTQVKGLKKGWNEKTEIEMGSQGRCSISADENKILIITIQAEKHLRIKLLMIWGLNCDY